MDKNPLVSICIPVFNGEEYILQAVQSVFNQTYKNLELIVIDNASDDGTIGILNALLQKTPIPFRLIQNEENIGFEGNWNKCLVCSEGEYIKILPADDILYPQNVEKQMQAIEQDPEVVLVSSGRDFIDSSNTKISSRNFFRMRGVFESSFIAKKMVRSGGNYLGEPGAVLMKKSAVEQAGNFDCSIFYVVDIDYYFRVMKYGKTAVIPDILGAFRVSDTSLSVVTKASQVKDYKSWYKKLYKEGTYNLTLWDIRVGLFRVRVNHLLKRIVYTFFVRNVGKVKAA